MEIEESIKKAIEGGWKSRNTINGTLIKESTVGAELILNGTMSLAWFLDPSFWQSLGKVMRWGDLAATDLHKTSPRGIEDPDLNSWLWHWHRFVDHLADGKTAEEYFKSL